MEPFTSVGELEASLRTETIGLPARPHPSGEPAPRIPDYRFVKVIGRGSFGTVWLAEETLAGVFRAIKVIHPARTRTPKPAQQEQQADSRLQRELDGIHAYQAAAKEHPHLVRILKVGLCKVAEAEKRSGVGPVSRPVNLEKRPEAVSGQRSAREAPAAPVGDPDAAADSAVQKIAFTRRVLSGRQRSRGFPVGEPAFG